MQRFLAIDAGGTSTRAVIVDASGRCLGYGRSGTGNPISSGIHAALASLGEAAEKAQQGVPGGAAALAGAAVAMAGASVQTHAHLFQERLATVGLAGDLVIESDLLAGFYSGTFHDNGYALVAGTGAVGARIKGGRLDAVGDGAGWLLGDEGSGFWLGREVVRAVVAALDGRGAPTALTALLLHEVGVSGETGERRDGRSLAQQALMNAVYALRPVELSRFAPLAFAPTGDAVAAEILDRAAAALARTLAAVLDPAVCGPLVFAGSVLTRGSAVATAVLAAVGPLPGSAGGAATATPAEDGMVGAAVVALQRSGIPVDADVHARISASLATLR
ncbi:N-acetylglucosamine kinase [Pseudarthrobacter sp. P1]|uniref:N-acetylglucosamine kinase n=1 Tax=Pseudarthrobacter sp. P1 TaxID=3418418 RepID=UPI003CFA2BC2